MALPASEEHRFKILVGPEANKFPRWTATDETVERFDAACVAEFLFAIGAALALIDERIALAERLFERLKKLYDWSTASAEECLVLSAEERVLAVIADAYVRGRSGMSTERIAAVTGLALETATTLLTRYESLGIVRKRTKKGDWFFRPAALH